MIVDRDTNPNQKIYFLGALLIEVIKNHRNGFDIFSIYEDFISNHGYISLDKFYLIMDWLFMLGIVDSQDGELKLCF